MSWEAWKQIAVSSIVYVNTFGQCPFAAPGETLQNDPKTCKYLREGTRIGVEFAMSYVGIPPTIPTAQELADHAAEYVATQAVSYAVGYAGGQWSEDLLNTANQAVGEDAVQFVTEEARQQAVSEIKERLLNLAKVEKCPFPASSLQDAKDKGFTGWDPLTQCAYTSKGASTANLGLKGEEALGDSQSAVAWIKVQRTSAPAPRGTVVTIRTEVAALSPNPNLPPALIKEIKDQNGLRLFKPITIQIDAHDVGPQGMMIPIMLNIDPADWVGWRQLVQRANICQVDAFYEQCVEDLAINTRNAMLLSSQTLTVSPSWLWTRDTGLTHACAGFNGDNGKPFCVDIDPRKAGSAAVFSGNFSRLNGSYGVPKYQNFCPGFGPHTDPDTGMPGIDTTWSVDDLK